MTNQLTYMGRRSVEWPDYLYPVMGALMGVLVTVPAVIIAMMSLATYWGPHTAARVVLPIAFMVAEATSHQVGWLAFLFACVQFPAYGLVVGIARMKNRRWGWFAAGAILLIHAAIVVACVVIEI